METFLSIHRDVIIGTLSTFDRLIFKGHLTSLYPQGAFARFLNSQQVLLKDFATYAETTTARLEARAQQVAADAKRAATLGASGWQTFWLVTLPALRWGLLYGLTLTLARALGEFGAVLVIGGGVQGQTETATIYIYRALEERQYVGAFSAALVLGLLSLTIVLGADLLRRKEK